MKRLTFLSLMLLLLTVGFSGQLSAQGGTIISPPSNPDSDGDGVPDSDDKCPNQAGPRSNRGCPENGSSDDGPDSPDSTEPTDDPSRDSDGDGLADKDDQCPTAGGPTWTGGCPEEDPPTSPDPNDIPDPNGDDPFIPPASPDDGCYVTPNGNYSVNVRQDPELVATQIGKLLSGIVYKSEDPIVKEANIWFVLNDYEGNVGNTGYAAGSVVLASGCDQSVAGGSSDGNLGVQNTIEAGRDCNDNGIDDLDEFFPPDCYGKLTTDNTNSASDEDIPTDNDLDWFWEQCPEGWVFYDDVGLVCEPLIVEAGSDNLKQLALAAHNYRSGEDSSDFLEDDDGDLDLFLVNAPGGDNAPERDCNDNGIDDLDEFFPPDCYGKSTSDNSNPASDEEEDIPTDNDLDWFWEQCPEGWVFYDDDGLVCEPLIVED